MSDSPIEPQPVIDLVERYVRRELDSASRYENSAPLDSSGVWSLHQLAREIYALGVQDGAAQERQRQSAQSQRDRDTARALAASIEGDPR